MLTSRKMRTDLVQLVQITAVLWIHVAVGGLLSEGAYLNPAATLRTGSVLTMWSVGVLFCLTTCSPPSGTRLSFPDERQVAYVLMTVVYSVGFVWFAWSYASTGVSITAATGFCIGLGVLVVDDMVDEAPMIPKEQFMLKAVVLFLSEAAVFVMLVTSDWAILDTRTTFDTQPDGTYTAILVAPVVIILLPLAMYGVREWTQRHCHNSIAELTRLAAPVALLIACATLCVIPSCPPGASCYTDIPPYPRPTPNETDHEPRRGETDPLPFSPDFHDSAYAPYRLIDYHDQAEAISNTTLPPPVYVEKDAKDALADAIGTCALYTLAACVSIPAMLKTMHRTTAGQTLDVMAPFTLALAVRHICVAGSTPVNRFALAMGVCTFSLHTAGRVLYGPPPKESGKGMQQKVRGGALYATPMGEEEAALAPV